MKREFWLGFVIMLLVFLALNVLWLHVRSDCGLPAWLGTSGCADDIRRAGFPFQFYEEGGFAFRRNFSLLLLILDGAIALGLSYAAGRATRTSLAPRGQG